MLVALALLGCKTYDDAHPLGMILEPDGVTYAGAAVIDLTPVIRETYTDTNGNFTFDGCLDNPTGVDCELGDETFDDVDGDGWFDATFIGGFGPMRPANGVHDPIYARAVVLSHDEAYVAFVALDVVGLGSPRIHAARDRLMYEGFGPDRLIVSSSHNHQAPDTMGLWGYPYDFVDPVSGIDPEYQERVTDAIEQAVRDAAAVMEPVDLRVATVRMRDRSVWFNGAAFGGKNPTRKMHGMVHDIRDPVVVSDQLLVMQGRRADGSTVFTFTNWSGHPEVKGGDNDLVSSDWVGVTREVLEARYGGVALHMPECLGGMQSALGGDVPLVDPDGTHVMSGETDGDGDLVPVWAPHGSWEFVNSHGWHIAEAASDAIEAGETIEATPIRVASETLYVPVENLAYRVLGPTGIFDLDLDDATYDAALCPDVLTDAESGCIPTNTLRVQVGKVGLMGVPGELLPEIAWGLPDGEAAWEAEVGTLTARGPDSVYFPQHPRECDDVDYEACREVEAVGDCDCLRMHASPYRYAQSDTMPPLLDLWGPEIEYRAVLGATDNYLSYIIPEPDFNFQVSLLSENDGDHYEDTVSPAHNFGTRLQEAHLRIAERW